MIDALVKVSEKIVALIDYRQKRQKLDYTTYIAPLYGALSDLHNDAIVMLEQTKRSFEERVPVLQIQASVQACRIKTDAQRRDLAAKIKVFRTTIEEPLYESFYRSAQTYLFNPRINSLTRAQKLAKSGNIAYSSVRSILANALAKIVDEDWIVTAQGLTQSESRLMTGYLDLVIAETRDSWDRVAIAHAKLQASLRQ